MYLGSFLPSSIGFGLFLLLLFSVLQWFQVPAGSFLDWVIGGLSFQWLVLITTVPWNIHFQAREVLAEAEQSQEKQIAIAPEKLRYTATLATRSLWVALLLHLLSAAVLYALAASGISAIGYLSSGAALLLTGLRPAIQGYEYLAERLRSIRQEFQYPREDVVELRDRVVQLEMMVQQLSQQLDPEYEGSWVERSQQFSGQMRGELAQALTAIERLRSDNASDHVQLAREARQGIAQLSEDSEFLNHARELIRFFKSA
jgi:hypothetical protein